MGAIGADARRSDGDAGHIRYDASGRGQVMIDFANPQFIE